MAEDYAEAHRNKARGGEGTAPLNPNEKRGEDVKGLGTYKPNRKWNDVTKKWEYPEEPKATPTPTKEGATQSNKIQKQALKNATKY